MGVHKTVKLKHMIVHKTVKFDITHGDLRLCECCGSKAANFTVVQADGKSYMTLCFNCRDVYLHPDVPLSSPEELRKNLAKYRVLYGG